MYIHVSTVSGVGLGDAVAGPLVLIWRWCVPAPVSCGGVSSKSYTGQKHDRAAFFLASRVARSTDRMVFFR